MYVPDEKGSKALSSAAIGRFMCGVLGLWVTQDLVTEEEGVCGVH